MRSSPSSGRRRIPPTAKGEPDEAVRRSPPTGDPSLNLTAFAADENPGLSEEQAQAIVSLTLGRLSGLGARR